MPRVAERGANLPREDLLAVLRFVHDYRERHEHSPSTREIQAELKMSAPSVVQRRVDALLRTGWATRDASAYRTLRPTALGLLQLMFVPKRPMTRRELGTVLAALRFWQSNVEDDERYDSNIATGDAAFEALTDDEIDVLYHDLGMSSIAGVE